MDDDAGDFFVGSTTDGAIFRGNVAGDGGEAEVFSEGGADGRETAIGMKVDDQDRLFVAGGATGGIFVHDTRSGDLIRAFENGVAQTFVNDVAVTPEGDAYFTDSMDQTLYRVRSPDNEVGELEPWLNLEGTPIESGDGFNLNGIVATDDSRFLVVVHSSTGMLYRIDTSSRQVVEIDLGGETLTNGDGLLLDGRNLYVVRNQQGRIVPVELSEDFATGTVREAVTDPSLRYPTTIARYENRLLVVNSHTESG